MILNMHVLKWTRISQQYKLKILKTREKLDSKKMNAIMTKVETNHMI